MTEHVLKIDAAPFAAVTRGRKLFEWRRDDGRNFVVGDTLKLVRQPMPGEAPTSPLWTIVRVVYIVRGPNYGIPGGYALMSIVAEDIGETFEHIYNLAWEAVLNASRGNLEHAQFAHRMLQVGLKALGARYGLDITVTKDLEL